MRPIACFLILLFFAPLLTLSGQEKPPDSSFDELLSEIKKTYPREEGSRGEEALILLIAEYLDSLDLSYQISDFNDFIGGHSFSRTIDLSIPGKIADSLIIAVPLNHPEDVGREMDGSINIATALAIAEKYAREEPLLSLRVLFLGAEFGKAEHYPMGSTKFLHDYFPEQEVSVFYLNLRTIPSRIVFETGGRSVVSPKWIITRTSSAIRGTEFPFLILGNRNQVFRIGMTEETAIEPYLQHNIPGLGIEGWYDEPDIAEPKVWIPEFLSFIEAFMQRNNEGFAGTWDRNYLFFQVQSRYLIIGEQMYLIIILLALGLPLAYGLTFRHRIGRYIKSIFSNFWNLPLFLWLIFFFLFFSTMLLDWFLEVRGFPSLWEYIPFPLFLLKIALSIFLFSLLLKLLHRLPLTKSGTFYSASAIFLLVIDAIILAIFNIDFSYYFIWAFVFAFLFSLSRNRYLKLLFLLASPFWLVKLAADIFTLPELELCRVLLLSPIIGNLLLAVITLPFLLMIVRIDFLIRHPAKGKASLPLRATIWGTGLLSLTVIIFSVFFNPFGEDNLLPMTVTENIDRIEESRSLNLSAPHTLGSVEYEYGTENFEFYSTELENSTELGPPPELLEIDREDDLFLDRHQVSLTVLPDLEIDDIDVRLHSGDPIVLYDSTFPVTTMNESREVQIHIGKNPPLPLSFNFTVPRMLRYTIHVRTESEQLVRDFTLIRPEAELEKRLIIRKQVPEGLGP